MVGMNTTHGSVA